MLLWNHQTITVLTRAATGPHTVLLRSTTPSLPSMSLLLSSSHLLLSLPRSLYSSGLPNKICMPLYYLPCVLRPFQTSWIYHLTVWWRVQIIEPLPSIFFDPPLTLTSKCSPQHHVLKSRNLYSYSTLPLLRTSTAFYNYYSSRFKTKAFRR